MYNIMRICVATPKSVKIPNANVHQNIREGTSGNLQKKSQVLHMMKVYFMKIQKKYSQNLVTPWEHIGVK